MRGYHAPASRANIVPISRRRALERRPRLPLQDEPVGSLHAYMRCPGRRVGSGRLCRGTDGPSRRPRRHHGREGAAVRRHHGLFGGRHLDPRQPPPAGRRHHAIRARRRSPISPHHVGNRLDRAEAEAYVDNAPRMLELFEREGFVRFYAGADLGRLSSRRARRLARRPLAGPDEYDGRELGTWFAKLRPPIKTMMALRRHDGRAQRSPHIFQMTHSPQVGPACGPAWWRAMRAIG